MIKHGIIIASSYLRGERVALDYSSPESLDLETMYSDIKKIYDKVGKGAPISTHFLSVEKDGWNNVAKKDKFFASIRLIPTVDEFIDILAKDQILSGLDIAKYVLTKVPCTHLKLEKLVYMCYADYLCNTKKRLFEDKIYAYRLGPVIESVYKKYKKSGYKPLSDEDDKKLYDETKYQMPIRSRIISSEKGLEKLISIDTTLKVYAKYSAEELVKITHKDQSPWQKCGAGEKENFEIDDNTILKYHKYEII